MGRDALGSEPACKECGAAVPPDARFCPSCGTATALAPEREARKTVTLLFTDVTGSTAMGERLDPEAYRGVMTRYFAVARRAIERHGGTVEKFVGDAVLSVFGVPDVHEDDALRALRAAQELRADVEALSVELEATAGVTLQIRTGINTGQVVTGTSRAGGSFATGDAVNVAARLEQTAGAGEILLGADTYALVRDGVRVTEVEPVAAKGKTQLLRAFRLLEVLATVDDRGRRPQRPLIGRAQELRMLDDVWGRVLTTGRSHLVTVIGAAGVGKSRLVTEFLGRIGGQATVASGRCVSYGQGITFWPIVQLIREALALTGREPLEETRETLDRLMVGSDDAGQVVDLILPLLGRSEIPGDAEETGWSIGRLLEQLARQQPVVVHVDDLHWAEPTLLELLRRVRDDIADLPILVVCQARPDLLDRHPDWAGRSLNAVTLGLEPFTLEQTRASLAQLMGDSLPSDVVALVSEWSAGNALFVEEIASHLVESGVVRRSGDEWIVSGDLSSTPMPPTVSALVAARLDQLPADEKELVSRVAVIGLEFTRSQAVALSDTDETTTSALLANLVHRDLLRRQRGTSGETWAFRHVIIRDAAYAALPKALRAELHRNFAETIPEGLGNERSLFVAHHLVSAALDTLALAPHDVRVVPLVEEAARACASAAHEARDRDDPGLADSLLVRALSLPIRDRHLRLDLLSQHAQDLVELGRINQVLEVLDEFDHALDGVDSDLLEAHADSERLLARMCASEDVDPVVVAESAERAATLAQAEGDVRRFAMAARARSVALQMRGDFVGAHQAVAELKECSVRDARGVEVSHAVSLLFGPAPLESLLELTEARRSSARLSPNKVANNAMLRFLALAGLGSPRAEEAAAEMHRVVAADGVDAGTAAETWGASGFGYYFLGDLHEAGRRYRRMIEDQRAGGDLSHASTTIGLLAMTELECGADTGVVRALLDEGRASTSRHDVVSVALNACVEAVLLAREGDLDRAAERAREAVRAIDEGSQIWQEADIRLWVSEVFRRIGDHEMEHRLLEEALERYERKHLRPLATRCRALLEALPGG